MSGTLTIDNRTGVNVGELNEDAGALADGYVVPTASRCEMGQRGGESQDVPNKIPVIGRTNGVNDTIARKPRARGGKQSAMNEKYSDAILAIILEDPTVKRGCVFERLLKYLNLHHGDVPADFPTAEQVANKVSNLKRRKSFKFIIK